jgi:hypothetical protein
MTAKNKFKKRMEIRESKIQGHLYKKDFMGKTRKRS